MSSDSVSSQRARAVRSAQGKADAVGARDSESLSARRNER